MATVTNGQYVMKNARINGENLADFRSEWQKLSEKDKEDLKDWAAVEREVINDPTR